MKINSDFRDMLRDLNEAGVRYLIVGGYAVMVHTEPRYTKDLDIWIEPVEPNAQRLFLALAKFGAPTNDIDPIVFTEPEIFFQISMEPVRIAIMTSVFGLDFGDIGNSKLVLLKRAERDFTSTKLPGCFRKLRQRQPSLLHHLLHRFRLAFAKIRVTGVHCSNRRCADSESRGHKDGRAATQWTRSQYRFARHE